MKIKKQKRKLKSRYKKYVAGGMYADNTVSAAGQGMPGSTANIIFDQSNPKILTENLNYLDKIKNQISSENDNIVSELKQEDEQSKIDIEQASAKQQGKVDMAGTVIGTGLQAGKQSGLISKEAGSLRLKDAVKAYKAQKAINLASQSKDIGTATQAAEVAGTAGTVGSGVQAATTGSGIVSGTAGGVTSGGFGAVTSGTQAAQTAGTVGTAGTAATTASTAGQTGSAVAAGLGTLAKNPNIYALAAQYGGKAIRKKYDDKDATTWTRGEATGDILGKAGEYASYGAMLGSVVPGVGNLIGAGVGAVIGAGVGTYKGLTGRKKARKTKGDFELKRQKQVDAYNTEVISNLLKANAQVKAGEMEQKTYSGYDLGRNVVAKMGGMRMGMPRYGYAA